MLRIIAGSDFHYPRRVRDLAPLREMAKADADVLVLAGDMVDTFDPVAIMELLEATEAFAGPRLYVWGNHELWSPRTEARKIHEQAIPALARAAGFHVPEFDGPLFVGNVAIVGTMGWYDYAFALGADAPDAEVVSMDVEARRLKLRRSGRTLADFTPEDYASKELSWAVGDTVKVATWADGPRARWDVSDEALVDESLARLQVHLTEAAAKAERIVAITHMVPAAEGLHGDGDGDVWRTWIRAFMGTPRLGELFDAEDKVEQVIFGHCHRGRSFERAGWRGQLVASPRGHATLIEVPA